MRWRWLLCLLLSGCRPTATEISSTSRNADIVTFEASACDSTLVINCQNARMILRFDDCATEKTMESPEWIRFEENRYQCFEGELWHRADF